jgi:hypothetical protein
MNAKAKGTRNEHRSRLLLEAAGYAVTRAAASLGDWGPHRDQLGRHRPRPGQDAGLAMRFGAGGPDRLPGAAQRPPARPSVARSPAAARRARAGKVVVSDPARALEALDHAIAECEPEGLGRLALALTARLGTVAARMAGAPARRWAPAERAAETAGVDVAQLCRWARRDGVTWASWPTLLRAALV